MFGAILKATNSSFQKGMTFCRCIYVKKVMMLPAFIFEQPSYSLGSSDVNVTSIDAAFKQLATTLQEGFYLPKP